MAKHRFNGMGGGMMPNMNNMLKQAQKMQAEMEKMQAEMEETKYDATAGGGAVAVTVSGKKELLEVKISPEACDPDDVEMLQDLIIVAVNDAMKKADEASASQIGKITGGMNIPGLF